MAKLIDISKWPEQPWWNTGGTRNKMVYLCPDDGHLYYFKQSFNKGQRNYKYEFWSEVIASEIGQALGFDILSYDVAIRESVVGCLSKSMIDQSKEELIEGGKYLTAYDNAFQPTEYASRKMYDFQLIATALGSFSREKYLTNLVEMMVFDALIGNSDRHQENWALVHVNSRISESISQLTEQIETGGLDRMLAWYRKLTTALFTTKGKRTSNVERARLLLPKTTRFSPIYDSGCSFGRELDDTAIADLLGNRERLMKYVKDGKCEIHWEKRKLGHFEILRNIMREPELGKVIRDTIIRTQQTYSKERVASIVDSIDLKLKDVLPNEVLPQVRKDFICAVVHLRMSALNELIKD